MEIDKAEAPKLSFQLQFDRPITLKIKIAEWNPEKDLLAMVGEDSKIVLHRFNWQRLWTVSPGRNVSSLCWRPDGKVIAAGLEDGSVSLHDVESGKLLRSFKYHNVAVISLKWELDEQVVEDDSDSWPLQYEDRTSRFFPSFPRVPRATGVAAVDGGFIDEPEDSFWELSNSSHQCFNILCSGDVNGNIFFSIFGIFPISKINIGELAGLDSKNAHQLQNASFQRVCLSKNLCKLIVLCFGEHVMKTVNPKDMSECGQNVSAGLHCLLLNTYIFRSRKNELCQVAQQASRIEDLMDVVRVSVSLMHKQWAVAMCTFHDKFDLLSSLIADHGLDSTPQEEFLSLLGGARTSSPVHQFLVSSLGEAGLKRVSKAVESAGNELNLIVHEHLQPAAEIIAFRSGELSSLSRWRARFGNIGLDETVMNSTTEKAGMLLVQIERFLRVLAGVLCQFKNFFAWLFRCIKLLMSDPVEQLPPFNSEIVIIFLKFLYELDPVRQLLEHTELSHYIDVDTDTMQRIQELSKFGGFVETQYMQRSLAKEFEHMENSFKLAFQMPFNALSRKIYVEDVLPLCHVQSYQPFCSSYIPMSLSCYEDDARSAADTCQKYLNYICFKIPDLSASRQPCVIGISRGFTHALSYCSDQFILMEAVLLRIPDGYQCVDLSFYKDYQVALLLNEVSTIFEGPGKALLMIIETRDLLFKPVFAASSDYPWFFDGLMDCIVQLHMDFGKVRSIPDAVHAPLAISASRGIACVFTSRKHALVYILEEDEVSDVE